MRYILFLGIIIFILLISSCSRIDWYRYYDNCVPCEKGVYVCQCDSGSFLMGLGWTQNFRMVGPPYIPLFPIPIGDSKRIYVFVYPKYDSIYHFPDAPEFALRPKGSDVLINPVRADTNGRSPHPYSYRFLFDIGKYSPDTLEVVFLKKYYGCEQQPVIFIASKKTEYEPLVFPSN